MSIVEKAADRLRQTNRNGPRDLRSHGAEGRVDPPGHSQPTSEANSANSAVQGHTTPVEQRANGHTEAPHSRIQLNTAHLRRAGLLPPESMAPELAREYQRIKRPLLTSIAEASRLPGATGTNRLMVTSALPGEGKTFTSFNLALSLARERDYSVLLVDGDVLKPAVTRALGLGGHPGLMDVLSGDHVTPSEVIVSTDVPGFSVMPAGQRSDEMAELLSSRRMAWLADQLSADPNRIVVFDSSPLLATAESQALALNIGQVVMVVKAGYTERNAIDSALSLIAAPERAVNLILNQVRRGHGDNYAGYYGMYYGAADGPEQ